MDSLGADSSMYVNIAWMVVVGVLEGITPCPHTWPVVVPFAVGAHRVRKAMAAATAFFVGKIIAAPVVGALLGASLNVLPDVVESIVEWTTATLVFGFSGLLLLRPDALHMHEHCCEEHPGGEETPHEHEPSFEPKPAHPQGGPHLHEAPGLQYGTYALLFVAGAATMLVPDPVWGMAAKFSQDSHSWWKGVVYFQTHAVTSGIVLLVITWMIARFAWAVRGLGDVKVEAMLVRITSAVVIAALAVNLAMGGHDHGADGGSDEPHLHTPADEHSHAPGRH